MKLVFTILAGRGLAPCISARYAYITHPYYVSMAQKFVWTPALTANYKNRALGNFSKLGLNHVRKEFVPNDFWLKIAKVLLVFFWNLQKPPPTALSTAANNPLPSQRRKDWESCSTGVFAGESHGHNENSTGLFRFNYQLLSTRMCETIFFVEKNKNTSNHQMFLLNL